jgi:hypothetical protein
MALRAVQEAGEITFIGFSLPPTDFMADTLFRQGRLGYSKDNISVIAPNATEMKVRFEQLFGPSVKFIDKTFTDGATTPSLPSGEQFQQIILSGNLIT